MTTQRRGGLGRGLGALIPTGPAVPDNGGVVAGARFQEIPLDAIVPNRKQPREHFDEEALAELVISIREVGLLQPIVVRDVGEGLFELVMGERRFRASKEAGLSAVPAIIRDTADDAMLRDALLENLHRQQLNPLEEAAAYRQLLDDFGATHEELATRIGRSRSQVTNMLRLLHLPTGVQRRVAAGVLTAGHARALLALDDVEEMEQLAHRIVAEGLSVRAVEETVHVGQPRGSGGRSGPKHAAAVSPAVIELAERLSDYFDTRVKVDLGRRRGKITVEFASIDDLERVVELMAPDLPGEVVPESSARRASTGDGTGE